MDPADRPEDPGPLGRSLEGPVVEHAGQGDLAGYDLGVLHVDVLDRRPERAGNGDRVHLLPEQVAGVHVHPDRRADFGPEGEGVGTL